MVADTDHCNVWKTSKTVIIENTFLFRLEFYICENLGMLTLDKVNINLPSSVIMLNHFQ